MTIDIHMMGIDDIMQDPSNISSIYRLTKSTANLSTWDFIIFGLFLGISTIIGLYFMYQERRKNKNSGFKSQQAQAEDYLFAGKQLSAFPVAMSLTASFMSALTMLGWPTEFYLYGTMFCWFMLTYFLVACITAYVFIPMFYNAKVNSTYEFLDKRFDSTFLRLLTEIVYILNTVLYAGIVCYAPALALNVVLDISLWGGVALTAGVCTFYTTLGGLKAVVWTDVFQSVIMVSGFLMITIKGCTDFGGINNIWENAVEGGRIDFIHFEFDLTERHTFWSIVVGGTLGLWLGTFACNQTEVQRYLSCKSLKQAQWAIFIAVGNLFILVCLGCLAGLCMYSYYKYCDPISANWVDKSDQLIPYLVVDIFSPYPGLAGLYIASIYSGTLSTVSSGINSMATVALLDFVDPLINFESQKSRNLVMKVLVLFFGGCCIFSAFLADQLGGVLEAAMSVNGIVFGPTLGLFILAGLFPEKGLGVPFSKGKYQIKINKYGAISGYLTGIILGTWVYIGSKAYPPSPEHINELPTTTEYCVNATNIRPPKNLTDFEDYPAIADDFYAMSYMFYSTFGLGGALIVGVVVSVVTGNVLKMN